MTRFVVSKPGCEDSEHGEVDGCSYRVGWKINPHMRVGAACPSRAAHEHAIYVRALRRLGAEVVELPFVHGAYDCVFTKDAAIVSDGRALMTRPCHLERIREQHARATQLRERGFSIENAATTLEGGDVIVLPHQPIALLGHGFRSDAASARHLARFLGRQVITLELRDPSLYHLDTALAVLEDGSALFCEEAFTDAALRALRSLQWTALYRVPRSEALQLALNFVEIGDHVVSGSDGVNSGVEVGRVLRSHGLRLVPTSLGQFHLAGGSAACLAARVLDVAVTHAGANRRGAMAS